MKSLRHFAGTAVCVALVALAVPVATELGDPAGAQTTSTTAPASTTTTAATSSTFSNGGSSGPPPADTLYGEGGSFAEPIVNQLLINDASGIEPLNGAYFVANIDQGRNDFADGDADFAVTELPLTSAQQTTAQGGNRQFAYVPFAAQPIAIDALLECNPTQTLQSNTFCSNLQLTIPLLEGLMTGGISSWEDPQLDQMMGGQPPTPSYPNVHPEYQVDPSAVTATLSFAFEDDPTAQPAFSTWLSEQSNIPNTAGPIETWGNGLEGGDLAVVNALVPLNETTNLPQNPPDWGIGDIAPLPLDWNGSPRTIPTVAMQNGAGAYVSPTVAGTEAALNDAQFDATTNLVTFQSSTTDTAAYPLVAMSYFVVPLTGLSSAKATALAQFVGYVLSTQVQSQLPSMGAAPVTSAMDQAGMTVVAELKAEAASAPTTTTTPSSGSGVSSASSGYGSGGGSSLAFTGGNPIPIAGTGAVLVALGVAARRRLRRTGRSVPPPHEEAVH